MPISVMCRIHIPYHNTCLTNLHLPRATGMPPLPLQISHSKSQPRVDPQQLTVQSELPVPTANGTSPTGLPHCACEWSRNVRQPARAQKQLKREERTCFIQVGQLTGSDSDPGLVHKGVDRLALSLAIDDMDDGRVCALYFCLSTQ